MQGKITLITPPDIFENNNLSILFVNLKDQEQDNVSKWLSTSSFDNLNLYVYNGEPNIPWFLYAANRCEYKYINLDGLNYTALAMSGYILGKSGVYYKSLDENVIAIYSHINQNKVNQVEKFLEIALREQTS